MPTREELLGYLNLAEEQLIQSTRFEDELRDLSLKIYYLNKPNKGIYSQTLTSYLQWLDKLLPQIAEQTDILTIHRDQLRQWISTTEE